MEIIEEKPISIFEVKDEMVEMKKRDKELNFRAKKVEEYSNNIVKLKKSKELKKDLKELGISRLKEKSIIHMINILPKDMESVKVILTSENLTLKEEDLKKILDTVNKYA